MKSKSAKEKGRRYENKIAGYIRESGLDLRAGREIGSGSGNMKGDIRANIPFLIEVKNQKTIKILNWIDQAKKQAAVGWSPREKWALVFRDPRTPETHSEDYVTIDIHQFLELLKKNSKPIIKSKDKNVKYKIEKMIQAAKDVIKILP